MACKLNHPVYDMLYLILARRNSAPLLTRDKKLKGVALKSGVEVSLEL
jgi:predicted nucleic acid-binding protein